MQPPAQYETGRTKKGFPRGAKIAIIVGLVVLLLIVGLVVAGAAWFWKAVSGPADVANKYVEAVNNGDLSTAWNYLSSEAQAEEGRSGFESKVEVLEGEIKSWNTSNIQVENNTATITMDLKAKTGEKGTWEMKLVKEDGEWKILVYEGGTE